jgi:hypothetical protein
MLVDLWNDTAPGLGLNNSAEQCDQSGGGSDPEHNPAIGNCSAATITKGVCLLHATPIIDHLNTTDPGNCCAACMANQQCIAWNTNTGSSGRSSGCYLRSKGTPIGPSDPACNGMGIMRGEPTPSPGKHKLPYPTLGPNGEPNPSCTYEDDLFLSRVKSTIMQHDPATPLFFFWAAHTIHAPLQVPKAWYDKYAHISAGAQPDERRRKYLAMVNWLDDAVGNVTALLKSKQMYDNTLIVFSSE